MAFFEFIGLIIGKALYEGILLDVAFAEFFLKKCLGGINYREYGIVGLAIWNHIINYHLYGNVVDDLRSLDPELYNGLIAVKNFRGNVEDLSLDFTLTQDGKSLLCMTREMKLSAALFLGGAWIDKMY